MARPTLKDPNFRHVVVLLFQHDDAGSMGIVVNRPTRYRVADLVDKIEGLKGRQDHIWIGGPVQPNAVWVLHQRADLDDPGATVSPGLFLGGSPTLLRELMLTTPQNPASAVFRVVRGYAGWAPGQLDTEIKDGAWHVAGVEREVIFGAESDILWEDVLARAQLPFPLPPGALRVARLN